MTLNKNLAILGVALVLFWVGRCSSPHPQPPSRDSTRAMNTRDTVLVIDSSLATALGLANRELTRLRHRSPVPVPPRPDSGGLTQGQTDTVYRRMADDSATIAGLLDTLAVVRDTLASVRKRLPGVAETLERSANRIGRLERRRERPWSSGVLVEGIRPTGFYIARDVFALRLQAEVSDGPNEPPTVRVGVGLRW